MSNPNDFTRRLIDKADAKGWIVVDYRAAAPCSITLEDRSGVRIIIGSQHGLGLEEYLDQLTARPPQRAALRPTDFGEIPASLREWRDE